MTTNSFQVGIENPFHGGKQGLFEHKKLAPPKQQGHTWLALRIRHSNMASYKWKKTTFEIPMLQNSAQQNGSRFMFLASFGVGLASGCHPILYYTNYQVATVPSGSYFRNGRSKPQGIEVEPVDHITSASRQTCSSSWAMPASGSSSEAGQPSPTP